MNRILRIIKSGIKIAPILRGVINFRRNRNTDLMHSRLSKCADCPYLDYDYEFFCSKCDCTLKYKASDSKELCPINKW